MADQTVLFYDGVCGFCNRIVRFVLAHDRDGQFRFASLQSEYARDALEPYGRDPSDLDTFYLIADVGGDGERLLERSRAGIEVLRRLPGWPRALGTMLEWLPRAVTDFGYGLVVKNRYRIFGKYDSCPLPSPETRARFIEV